MEPSRVRPRTPTREELAAASSEEEVAALIAGIILGSILLPEGIEMAEAIANLLSSLPNPPPASVNRRVAEMVVEDRTSLSGALDGRLEALTHNLGYQALYAIHSARRISEDVDEGWSLDDAIERESYNRSLHVRAVRARDMGASLNLSMSEMYGTTTLSWNHLGIAKTHRPSHERANGKNYDLTNPPAATGGMLPGMEPNCDCVPGPPIPGAGRV